MSIETEEVAKTVERGNDLMVETAQTLVDGAYLAPRQALQLGQAIAETVEASHQASRDLAGRLVRQTLEGQALWWRFFQETMQLSLDTFARAPQVSPVNPQERAQPGTEGTALEKRAVAAGM